MSIIICKYFERCYNFKNPQMGKIVRFKTKISKYFHF